MHSTFTVVFSKLVPQANNDNLIDRDPIHKLTGYIILIELMPAERTLCFADEEPDKLFSTSQTNPSTKKTAVSHQLDADFSPTPEIFQRKAFIL